jgi:polysaccharide pyruvyl transferase WcaK-like protein
MIVEIIGTQFVNKGAELMLLAIREEFKKRNLNVTFCIEPNSYLSPYTKLAPLNIKMKIPYNKKGINIRWTNKLISNNFKEAYGLVADNDIDVYLDASGFLYSDQWGKNSARKLACSIEKWKKQGSKVIILPQAFGPFSSKRIRKHMSTIINHADLIFARESDSYNYLNSISNNKNIFIAPDFTNLLSMKLDENSIYTNKICIIPNKRMIDKTNDAELYIRSLKNMILELEKNSVDYFFLIHEGEQDKEIVKNLNLQKEPLLVETSDALEIKKIIGESKGMIGSRFHGLVSSLSQAKPVIAMGWSHNYLWIIIVKSIIIKLIKTIMMN